MNTPFTEENINFTSIKDLIDHCIPFYNKYAKPTNGTLHLSIPIELMKEAMDYLTSLGITNVELHDSSNEEIQK